MSSQEINNGYMTYSLYSRERKEMIFSTIQHDILMVNMKILCCINNLVFVKQRKNNLRSGGKKKFKKERKIKEENIDWCL